MSAENTVAKITLYESGLCGYCRAARILLDKKGWPYNSLVVDGDRDLFDSMVQRTGQETVPQIYFGEHHVGGFDDLAELDSLGELDDLYAKT